MPLAAHEARRSLARATAAAWTLAALELTAAALALPIVLHNVSVHPAPLTASILLPGLLWAVIAATLNGRHVWPAVAGILYASAASLALVWFAALTVILVGPTRFLANRESWATVAVAVIAILLAYHLYLIHHLARTVSLDRSDEPLTRAGFEVLPAPRQACAQPRDHPSIPHPPPDRQHR